MGIADGQPSSENHIQYHGGFLEGKEWHTAADSDRGYLYRMGVRHYSPALGRFLQRDPLSYMGAPSGYSPLSINPYAYGLNDQLAYSDTSGYQPSFGGSGSLPQPPGRAPWLPPLVPYEPPLNTDDCMIRFPQGSGCMFWGYWDNCCRTNSQQTPHANCGPCDTDHVWFSTVPPAIWTYPKCRCWCCAHWVEENSPQRTDSPFSEGYYIRPALGPKGNDGDPGIVNPKWPDIIIEPYRQQQHLSTEDVTLTSTLNIGISTGENIVSGLHQAWWKIFLTTAPSAFCRNVDNSADPSCEYLDYLQGLRDCCCTYNNCISNLFYLSLAVISGLAGAYLGGAIGYLGGGIIGAAWGAITGFSSGYGAIRIATLGLCAVELERCAIDKWYEHPHPE